MCAAGGSKGSLGAVISVSLAIWAIRRNTSFLGPKETAWKERGLLKAWSEMGLISLGRHDTAHPSDMAALHRVRIVSSEMLHSPSDKNITTGVLVITVIQFVPQTKRRILTSRRSSISS